MILREKNNYFIRRSEKLNDPLLAPKTYWSILNEFLNNVKIPTIPSLYIDHHIISNVAVKVNTFNSYFASHCTTINNLSQPPEFSYKNEKRINSLNFNENDIFDIINFRS